MTRRRRVTRTRSLFVLAALCSVNEVSSTASGTIRSIRRATSPVVLPQQHGLSIELTSKATTILSLRGGASASSTSSTSKNSSSPSSKKSKKKKRKKTDSATTSKAKKVIDEAMKEKDSAEALGDAIRDRADILRSEDPLLQSIDWSIDSLGYALGASDLRRLGDLKTKDGGGVQPALSSVIANYFLKSHGGAHALQCFCSLLATVSGVAAIALHDKNSALAFVFMQRTLQYAMIKHVSGLLAAASIAAKAIPKIGLSQTRLWMERLVLDPVAQYVFYTSLLLLWLPSKQRLDACWWWKKTWISPILIGPVLIREFISNLLVISDLLVLWSVGNTSATVIQSILKVSQSMINVVMSLLVSPTLWRSANPAERQAILAKLISRISLALEVAVGPILCLDLLYGLFAAAFYSGAQRPPFRESLARLVCVRLYLHFLWIRRVKIGKLTNKLRGGASQVPFWILNTIYEPAKSMGLDLPASHEDPNEWTWKDYLTVAMDMETSKSKSN